MIQRIRAKIQSLPSAARLLLAFIAGAVLNFIFFGIAAGIYILTGFRMNEPTELMIGLYPVFLCCISSLLEEDLKGTVLACIGASTVLTVPFFMDHYGMISLIIAFIFSLHGVCLSHGRKPGFKAAFLRALCLVPTFGEACFNWDGKPWFYMALLLVLGLFGYWIAGKKNTFTIEGLSVPFIMILLSAVLFASPLSYILFLLFNPSYYP